MGVSHWYPLQSSIGLLWRACSRKTLSLSFVCSLLVECWEISLQVECASCRAHGSKIPWLWVTLRTAARTTGIVVTSIHFIMALKTTIRSSSVSSALPQGYPDDTTEMDGKSLSNRCHRTSLDRQLRFSGKGATIQQTASPQADCCRSVPFSQAGQLTGDAVRHGPSALGRDAISLDIVLRIRPQHTTET